MKRKQESRVCLGFVKAKSRNRFEIFISEQAQLISVDFASAFATIWIFFSFHLCQGAC